MNKRLRKKKLVGEFKRLGFRVIVHHPWLGDDWTEADVFTNELIDFVVANGMGVTGGGTHTSDFVVCGLLPKKHLQRRSRCCSLTDRHRVVLVEWLAHRADVDGFRVGRLFDIVHGSTDEWNRSVRTSPVSSHFDPFDPADVVDGGSSFTFTVDEWSDGKEQAQTSP